jgi:ribosome-associated protein
MESIDITTPVINLDQLLKFAGIVETGGQVKLFVEEGLVWLNGTVITERRKKIRPGDIVEIKGIGIWKVMLE